MDTDEKGNNFAMSQGRKRRKKEKNSQCVKDGSKVNCGALAISGTVDKVDPYILELQVADF